MAQFDMIFYTAPFHSHCKASHCKTEACLWIRYTGDQNFLEKSSIMLMRVFFLNFGQMFED